MQLRAEAKRPERDTAPARRPETVPASDVHNTDALTRYRDALGNRAVERLAAEEGRATPFEPRRSAEAESGSEAPAAPSEPAAGSVENAAPVAEGEPGVALALPEAAETAEEAGAAIEPVTLEGRSEEALGHFADASASQVAAAYPGLGGTLNAKLGDERAEAAKNAPVLAARSDASSKEAGGTEAVALPPEGGSAELPTAPEPAPAVPAPHRDLAPPPDNAPSRRFVDAQGGGGFLEWFKKRFESFFQTIKTRDPGVNTRAGKAPKVALEGQADPSRADGEKARAQREVTQGRDALAKTISEHPGQQKIQPKNVDTKQPVILAGEVGAAAPTQAEAGMADYAAVALPKEVRRHADELLQPVLSKSLGTLKSRSKEAAQRKEKERQARVARADAEVKTLNTRATGEQRRIVAARRREVADEQKRGIKDAYDGVKRFSADAKTERQRIRKGIDAKVKAADGEARKELEKGEKAADRIKQEKEKEAAAKKEQLNRARKKKSWWRRAVDAVKSAVRALTKAIDGIFNAMRRLVKKAIDAAKKLAIRAINAARKWVIKKLEAFRKWAKSMVNKYVKKYFPKLAKKLNKAIDAVVDRAVKTVNKVADGLIRGVKALAKALSKALDKILSVFQTALKAAVQIAGALLTGDFAEALKVAIQAACDIAGIDSKPIFGFFDRAGAALMRILKSPVRFFKNLVKAVGNGIRNFVKNIKKHLIAGLIGWLTGALSEAEIELPKKLDFRGILSLALQILGLTYANIKARIIRKVPGAAKVFDAVEKGLAVVKEIALHGPSALWKQIKAALGNFKEMVLSSIRQFVIFTVVKEGITWLLGLLNPAGALVKVIKLLFDFVMFLVQRFAQIKDFVLSVYNSLAAIASGSLAVAAKAVEGALAKSLPVAISLLASLAGLGGIGQKVKQIVGRVSRPVNRVIDRVVDKAVAYAKKLLGRGKQGARKSARKRPAGVTLDRTLGSSIAFAAGGERHRLWVVRQGNRITVMAASDNPGPIAAHLKRWRAAAGGLDAAARQQALGHIAKAETLNTKVLKEASEQQQIINAALKDRQVSSAEAKKAQQADRETVAAERQLQSHLAALFGIFAQAESKRLLQKFRSQIAAAHPKAREPIRRSIAKRVERGPVKAATWTEMQRLLRSPESLETAQLYRRPLAGEQGYGRQLFGTGVGVMLEAAKTEQERWKAYKEAKGVAKDAAAAQQFLRDRVGVIHAGKANRAAPLKEGLQEHVYNAKLEGAVKLKMREYLLGSLKQEGSAEHGEYEPEAPSRFKVTGSAFTVFYRYKNKKGHAKPFVARFDFSAIKKRQVTQSTQGMGLSLKERGSRGQTVSSGKLKGYESAADAPLHSAHLLADWFRGSGYRQALNLVVTSARYNLEVMGGAEKKIAERVEHHDEAHRATSLFNLNVKATWEFLPDSEIKKIASVDSIGRQLKQANLFDAQGALNASKASHEKLYAILTGAQDPRRVLGVRYNGKITDPAGPALKEEIGCDIWMGERFAFDNTNSCRDKSA